MITCHLCTLLAFILTVKPRVKGSRQAQGNREFNNGFCCAVRKLKNENNGKCQIEFIGSCVNKVQLFRSPMMPTLYTLLHSHSTPVVMVNGLSCWDLFLEA